MFLNLLDFNIQWLPFDKDTVGWWFKSFWYVWCMNILCLTIVLSVCCISTPLKHTLTPLECIVRNKKTNHGSLIHPSSLLSSFFFHPSISLLLSFFSHPSIVPAFILLLSSIHRPCFHPSSLIHPSSLLSSFFSHPSISLLSSFFSHPCISLLSSFYSHPSIDSAFIRLLSSIHRPCFHPSLSSIQRSCFHPYSSLRSNIHVFWISRLSMDLHLMEIKHGSPSNGD